MKYATEQRLRLIDFLLANYGMVNRVAIIDYFDISPAAATRDFRKYEELCKSNMAYDPTSRFYLKTPNFNRFFK